MKSQPQLTVNDLLAATQNAKNEGVKSLLIQHNGVNLPVVSAKIQNIGEIYYEQKLVIIGETNKPKTSFFSGLFSKKEKPVPLNKQLHTAFFNALETVLISNGKNPNSFDFATFQEIKKSLAQFSEALENYANSTKSTAKSKNNSLGGDL